MTSPFSFPLLLLLLLLLLSPSPSLALADSSSSSSSSSISCSSLSSCSSCASSSSWLGLSCRWCPIDRRCHVAHSPSNSCAEQHSIQQPELCPTVRPPPAFNASDSVLAAVMAGAAYADRPDECVENFNELDLIDVTQVVENCDVIGDECSAFIGRLPSNRRLVLSFRGTRGSGQLLLEGLLSLAAPKQEFPGAGGGRVQRYFSSGFLTLWQAIQPAVLQLLTRHPDYSLLVTGHSLGGAMAALAAVTLVSQHSVPSSSLKFYSFGEPRVGDYEFARNFDILVQNSWRVVHARDIIPHVPICSPVYSSFSSRRLAPLSSPFSCSSHFGFPYHHGNEVFYPPSVVMRPGSSGWRLCQGTPVNEDSECANSSENWRHCMNPANTMECVQQHLAYYGIHLGKWWQINRCRGITETD